MKLQLQTEISAKFIAESPGPQTEAEAQSLAALNKHTEDVCESLQPIFQQLIIEMLELKRQAFGKGGTSDEGSQHSEIPSSDGTDG